MAMFGDDNAMTIVIKAKNETEKVFKRMQKDLNTFKGRMEKMQPAFKKMAVVGTATFGAVALGAKKAIDVARDFEEETNKFSVVFQDVSVEAEKMADTLNKSYGLSRLESKRLLSSTGDILTGFGFTGDAALDLSGNVNTLAVDLASFTNAQGGAKAVSDALTKALLGERESLKTYGIAIQEADVDAELLAMGMDGLTGEALRQAKAQATLNIAYRQSKNAVGDYARSTGSLTQTQVELSKTIEDMSLAIGQTLTPILNEILKIVLPIIEKIKEWVEENQKLTKTIIILTAAAVALVTIIGLIGLALPAIISGFGLLSTAILFLIGNPFTILIVLIVLMIANWKKVSIVIGVLISHIKALGKSMIAAGKLTLAILKDIVQAFWNWKDMLKDITKAIIKFFKGDFSGALNDFKNIARRTFDDTIRSFAKFGIESREITQELENELMEYANMWEMLNVDKKLEEINEQIKETEENTKDLGTGTGKAMEDMAKIAEEKAQDMITSIGKISDALDEVKESFAKLSEVDVEASKGRLTANQKLAEAFVDQEEKVADIRKQLGAETDAFKKQSLKEELKKEEDALNKKRTIEIAHQQEIENIRKERLLTDFERTVNDLNQKRTLFEMEIEKKRNDIQAEIKMNEEKFNDLIVIESDFALEAFDITKKLTDDKIKEYDREIRKLNELISAMAKASQLSISSSNRTISSNIPSREHGGIIPGARGMPVPIIAHGQEEIIPAGKTGNNGNGISLTINNPVFRNNEDERRLRQQLDKYFRPLITNHKLSF